MADKYVDLSYNTDVNVIGPAKQLRATITGITAAASAVVTAANDFSASDIVRFSGVVGMTEINGLTGTVSSPSGTQFTVNINSSAFTAYSSGGVATKEMDVSNAIRFIYDDTVSKARIYLTAQRFREWVARQLSM